MSVLACGFKSHFPHQCKGHSIFECPLFLYLGKSANPQITIILKSTLESHEIFDFVEAEFVPQIDKGKPQVSQSVLACGFKSLFPHQCKGHSIFRMSFIFISRQISKLLSSKTVTLESHEIFDLVEAELVPQYEIFDFVVEETCFLSQTGKPQVPQSVLACGFKSHFPHQCKGHSIFECPLFLF